MKNSVELTKAKPPKYWFTPLIWGLFFFYVVQLIFSLPLYIFVRMYMPSVEILVSLFSFAFIIIAVLLVNKYINKRSVEALGFHKEKWIAKYLIGVVIGTGLMAFTIVLSLLTGTMKIEYNVGANFGFVFLLLIGFLIQGMGEEVVCRAYIQNALLTRFGLVLSMIVQSLFFAFLHSMNPGIKLMPVINLFLYALFIGLLFYYTDNLWIAGGVHSIWNFIQGPVMGIEVSGLVMPSTIFKSNFVGKQILTGGAFGMEGSIFTTIVMCLGSLIVVYLLYMKKNEGAKNEI